MKKTKRSSGLLLHISSLGGDYGIGTMGAKAYEFADFLAQTGTLYWQILPFNSISQNFAYSPYAASSTFSGNPLLIDYDQVIKDFPFCSPYMLPPGEENRAYTIDFQRVSRENSAFLRETYELFNDMASPDIKDAFSAFKEQNRFWLDDFALYQSLSDYFNTPHWPLWDEEIQKREDQALSRYHELLSSECEYIRFTQFVFFRQWDRLKEYCNSKGVQIIGDLPIYVSFDSADGWAKGDIFLTDRDGRPDPVAGVPPDYFSETGQLWGNPLYKWFDNSGSLNGETLSWWIQRVRFLLEKVDMLRIDHFRAFESYWSVAKDEETAINGRWNRGPGIEFFEALEREIHRAPFIAEDLGIITEEVTLLREKLGFPGMRILQFAFDGNSENSYLPHNIDDSNTVYYTGTHDNNTLVGWYYGEELSAQNREQAFYYLNLSDNKKIHEQLIRSAMATTARWCILPVQDLLGLDGFHRFNTPGTFTTKNWSWKLSGSVDELKGEETFLKDLNKLYGRYTQMINKDKSSESGENG
jgi:4-alpha-glucanotransferase